MTIAKRLERSGENIYKYGICGLKLISNVPFVLSKEPPSNNGNAHIRFNLKSYDIPTEEIYPTKLALENIKNGAG